MDTNVTHEELIAKIRKLSKDRLYDLCAWVHHEDMTKILAMDLSKEAKAQLIEIFMNRGHVDRLLVEALAKD